MPTKDTSKAPIKPKSLKRVSFDKIYIREHRRILGDHPAVSSGPALTIDWYDENDAGVRDDVLNRSCHDPANAALRCRTIEVSVDDYEDTREPRKSCVPIVPLRKRIRLLQDAGVPINDITKAGKKNGVRPSMRKTLGNALRRVREIKQANSTEKELYELLKRCSIAEDRRKSLQREDSDSSMKDGLDLSPKKQGIVMCKILKPELHFQASDCTDDTDSEASEDSFYAMIPYLL